MHFFFLNHLAALGPVRYVLVFLGMFFEGDLMLFGTAFLARDGLFNIFVLLIVVPAGVMAGDFAWYGLGRIFSSRSPFWKPWIMRIAEPIELRFEQNPLRTLLVSKFTYSLHHLVLFHVGVLKKDVRAVMKTNALASLVWIFVVGGLGYSSSASFVFVRRSIRFVEISLLVSLIAFFFLEYGIKRVSKKRFLKNFQKNNDKRTL